MSNSPPGPNPTAEDTEHLLNSAARGYPPATDPLAALLTAAATPDPDRPLTGEDAAVTEFRAAGRPTVTVRRRTIRAVATAALAALTLSGVAVAADRAGLRLPLLQHHLAPPPSPAATQHTPTPAATQHTPTPAATQHTPTPPAVTTARNASTTTTLNDAEAPRADRRGAGPRASSERVHGRDQHATPARDRYKADRDNHLHKGRDNHRHTTEGK